MFFPHSILQTSKTLEMPDYLLSHWLFFSKFSCWSFLDLIGWQEEKIFVQQPGQLVLSQMTTELLVDWNTKELCCYTIRNNNPVDVCTAMTPKISKLGFTKYRILSATFFPFSYESNKMCQYLEVLTFKIKVNTALRVNRWYVLFQEWKY